MSESSKEPLSKNPNYNTKSNKGLYFIITMLFVLLMITSLWLTYLITVNETLYNEIYSLKKIKAEEVVKEKENDPFEQIEAATKKDEPITSFTKFFFEPSDKFNRGAPYPSEILGLKEEEMVGMNCSQHFVNYSDKGFVDIIVNPDYSVERIPADENNKAVSLATSYNYMNDKSNQISSIRLCEVEDGRSIYILGKQPRDYFRDEVTISFVVAPEGASQYDLIDYTTRKFGSSIDYNTGQIYYYCEKPLGLTLDNQLYYQCYSGHGGPGSMYILKVDLDNGSFEPIYDCAYTPGSITDSGLSKVQCSDGFESEFEEDDYLPEIVNNEWL